MLQLSVTGILLDEEEAIHILPELTWSTDNTRQYPVSNIHCDVTADSMKDSKFYFCEDCDFDVCCSCLIRLRTYGLTSIPIITGWIVRQANVGDLPLEIGNLIMEYVIMNEMPNYLHKKSSKRKRNWGDIARKLCPDCREILTRNRFLARIGGDGYKLEKGCHILHLTPMDKDKDCVYILQLETDFDRAKLGLNLEEKKIEDFVFDLHNFILRQWD